MLTLYEIIQGVCRQKKITVSKMCLEIGVSKSMMSDLKNGRKQNLSTDNLRKISEYLDVTVDYLLGNEKKTPVEDMTEVEEMVEALKDNPGMRILFSKTKHATKEDLEKIIKMVEIMKGNYDE